KFGQSKNRFAVETRRGCEDLRKSTRPQRAFASFAHRGGPHMRRPGATRKDVVEGEMDGVGTDEKREVKVLQTFARVCEGTQIGRGGDRKNRKADCVTTARGDRGAKRFCLRLGTRHHNGFPRERRWRHRAWPLRWCA